MPWSERWSAPGVRASSRSSWPAPRTVRGRLWICGGDEGRSAARLSLLLDYPFLVTYCGIQVAGCAAASDALRHRDANALATAGRLIGPAQIAAGAFDAVENTALLGVLAGRAGQLSAVARACAQAKFAVFIVGCLYEVLGVASHLSSR